LQFIKTVGGLPEVLRRIEFYTSHEALHLPYEQALTRTISGKRYNLATHFPWVGMRTAQFDSAHIEYISSINNPIAIKVGQKTTADELKKLIEIRNPDNQAGRLTLITRLGAKHIADHLPQLIETVKTTGITVLWISDPMHGNTTTTTNGYKTRNFEDILSELKQAFAIHRQLDSHLGGVHFELTGENVTECIGGARGLTETDLKQAYKTLVDPRLNYEQALEMAMLVVREFQ
jgi:3-deoxy-7-phosphoheptulonate synthase